MILPRRKLLLAAPALILPHRRADAQMMQAIVNSKASGAAPAAWTQVVVANAVGNINPLVTGAVDTTGANMLAAIAVYDIGSFPTITISDSKSNTWSTARSAFSFGSLGANIQCYYSVPSLTVGSGHTFTMNSSSGAVFGNFIVCAFKSAAGTPFYDVNGGFGASTGGGSTGSTTVPLTSFTPAHANDLVFIGLADNTAGAIVYSINSGYTIAMQVPTGSGSGGNYAAALAWSIWGNTATAPTWTISAPSGSGAATMALAMGS